LGDLLFYIVHQATKQEMLGGYVCAIVGIKLSQEAKAFTAVVLRAADASVGRIWLRLATQEKNMTQAAVCITFGVASSRDVSTGTTEGIRIMEVEALLYAKRGRTTFKPSTIGQWLTAMKKTSPLTA
jgi:hypothetical protein